MNQNNYVNKKDNDAVRLSHHQITTCLISCNELDEKFKTWKSLIL